MDKPPTTPGAQDPTPAFFVTGGTLSLDAPSYVERAADKQLLDALTQRQFAAVLDTRQIGKSSLMVRAADALRRSGTRVALLDLTRLGQPASPEQWYYGMLLDLGQQINLRTELRAFWQESKDLGPLQRWTEAIRQIALPAADTPLVLFIDEIDAVLSLPFSADPFFAAIRECYTRRADDPVFQHLTFCLLGSATPDTLMRDVRTTPFNIGVRIEPTDFTEGEALAFAPALTAGGRNGVKLLKRILYWTGGHPYLTQRLCQAVAEEAGVTSAAGVDRVCQNLFLSAAARERETNLTFVGSRLIRGVEDKTGVLDLYERVRSRGMGLGLGIKDDATDPLHQALRLAGIVRVVEGYLWVRNRIYFRVFDREWVKANMPDAELRRQGAAFRRGVLRTLIGFGAITAAMAGLAFTAIREKQAADLNALRAQKSAHEAHAQTALADAFALTARQQTRTAQQRALDRANALARALHEERLATTNAHLARLAEDDDAKQARTAKEKADEAIRNAALAQAANAHAQRSAALAQSAKVQAERNAKTAQERADYARQLAYDADMVLVQDEYQANDIVSVQSILSSYVPKNGEFDIRGVEWRYWTKMCSLQSSERSTDGDVISVSQDQKKEILMRPTDNRMEILTSQGMDALPGLDIAGTLLGCEVEAEFSPDTSHTLLHTADGSAWIYDSRTGRLLCKLPDFMGNNPGSSVDFPGCFSPDGRFIVTTSPDRTTHIWNTSDGSLVRKLQMPMLERTYDHSLEEAGGAGSFRFSPDGKFVAGIVGEKGDASYDQLAIWDIDTGAVIQKIKLPYQLLSTDRDIVFSPLNDALLISDAGALVIYSQGNSGQWEKTHMFDLADVTSGAEPAIYKMCWSHDAKSIACYLGSSEVCNIVVLDVETGYEFKRITGIELEPGWIKFSGDDSAIVGGCASEIKAWPIKTRTDCKVVMLGVDCHNVDVSPDGRHILFVQSDGTTQGHLKSIKMVDTATGKQQSIANKFQSSQRANAYSDDWIGYHTLFSPDSGMVAIGYEDGSVSLLNVASGMVVQQLPGSHSNIVKLIFSNSGKRLAVAHQNGIAEVWDCTTAKSCLTVAMPLTEDIYPEMARDYPIALSPDGKMLVTIYKRKRSGRQKLKIWNVDVHKQTYIVDFPHVDYHPAIVFPSESETGLCLNSSQVTEFSEASGRVKYSKYYTGTVSMTDIGFEPVVIDEEHLAIDQGDKFSIWDIKTGRTTLTLGKPYNWRIFPLKGGFAVVGEGEVEMWQFSKQKNSDQQSVVGSGTFATASAEGAMNDLDFHDITGAFARMASDTLSTFVGTVQSVTSEKDNSITYLNFDRQPKKALGASLVAENYWFFPPLKSLVGKRVSVQGHFYKDKNGAVRIFLFDPVQIKILQ